MERKRTSSSERFRSRPAAGSILIIALWSLCLLAAFAVILGTGIRQKYSLMTRLDERGALSFAAEAGVKKAIVELRKEAPRTYTALKDAWSNNPVVFKDMVISNAVVNIGYEHQDELSGNSGTRYGLSDEERKININTAEQEVLERLFHIVLNAGDDQARDLAAAVLDWRGGASGQASPDPAAASYYRGLQYSYHSRNKQFEVPEELLLVRGFNRDMFSLLRRYITIYGEGRVNINTASRAALLAVGLSDRAVEAVMALRCGADGISGTADDGIFETADGIVHQLSRHVSLSASETEQLAAATQAYLGINSGYFMVNCEAKLKGRRNTCRVDCIIDRSGTIVYWRES